MILLTQSNYDRSVPLIGSLLQLSFLTSRVLSLFFFFNLSSAQPIFWPFHSFSSGKIQREACLLLGEVLLGQYL